LSRILVDLGIGSGPHASFAIDLFDHLIRTQQNRWGYDKTERRGGLAVHDQALAKGERPGAIVRQIFDPR
jgi:hypothetical protein